MICKQCEQEIKDDIRFCPKCGAAVAAPLEEAAPLEDTQSPTITNEQEITNEQVPIEENAEPPMKKKPAISKKNKIALLVGIGIGCLVIVAGIIFLCWYFGSEQKLLRAIDSGNYDEAAAIYVQDYDGTASDSLISGMTQRLDTLKQQFIDEEVQYASAEQEISAIERLGISEIDKYIKSTRDYIKSLDTSRTSFAAAQEKFNSGDYSQAISLYKLVIEDDSNYDEAKTQLGKAVELFRKEIIAKTEGLADKKEYGEAIAVLENALMIAEEDSNLKLKLDEYKAMEFEAIKAEALAEAKEYANSEYYENAIKTLQQAIDVSDSDAELNEAYEKNVKSYVKQATSKADALMKKKKYDDAVTLIKKALEFLPDNKELSEKMASIEEAKPIPITSLTEINSHDWSWNEGSPVDPFGNDYSTASNYSITGSYYGTSYTEYRLYKEYSTLTGTIAPYKEIDEHSTFKVQIYCDDKLMYTSRDVTRKTDAYDFSVNVTNVEYVKIVIDHEYNGYSIISNVELWK